MSKDKRIDKYIADAQPFAQPILKHIREVVHKACPDIQETMKWSFPHFDYKGMMLCSMAGFKQHCVFMFWKQSIMKDPHKIFGARDAEGGLGRIKSIKDMPSDKILIEYIKQAMKLNDAGVTLPKKETKSSEKKELVVPDYLKKALAKNAKAKKTFENFSPSNRKEYITWLTEAKSEETRNSRLRLAIEWMAEGKIRNWKYLKK
jgi:uncharacterized protein YdeI (YjbR/CyaY-like superfamily)